MKLNKFLGDTISFQSGSVKIPLKSQIDTYRERYEKLSGEKKFNSQVYRIMPANRVMVHVKVPSSSLRRFYYDVLLELTPADKAAKLEDCEVQFFSNSPSFVYGGYAYLFYHMDVNGDQRKDSKANGMMIDLFRRKVPRENLLVHNTAKKLGKEAVTQEPEIRNPMGIAIPDSSIYYAIFHLQDTYSFNEVFRTKRIVTEVQALAAVSSFDHLMAERKKAVQLEGKTKQEKAAKEKKQVDGHLKKLRASVSGGKAVQRPKSARTVTGKGIRSAATNRGKSGGVNRIG